MICVMETEANECGACGMRLEHDDFGHVVELWKDAVVFGRIVTGRCPRCGVMNVGRVPEAADLARFIEFFPDVVE